MSSDPPLSPKFWTNCYDGTQNKNYFSNGGYVDAGEVVIPPGCVAVGISFYQKKDNRTAPALHYINPNDPNPDPLVMKNTNLDADYFSTKDQGYVDETQMNVPENMIICGVQFWHFGNRFTLALKWANQDGTQPQYADVYGNGYTNNQSYFDMKSYIDTTVKPGPSGSFLTGIQLAQNGNRLALQAAFQHR